MPDISNIGKEYVFWGVGAVARRVFSTNIPKEEISFFIDRDINKKEFLGKKVIHPQAIDNWNGLFVYIPYTIYAEVRRFLLSKNLKENIDFVSCGNLDTKLPREAIERDLERAISDIYMVASAWKHGILAFFDRLLSFKLYTDFLMQMRKNDIAFNIVTHDYWGGKEAICKAFNTDTIIHPKIFSAKTKVTDNIHLEKHEWEKIKDDSFLLHIAKHLYYYASEGKSMEECFYQTRCLVKYLDSFFDAIQPSVVLCSTTVTPSHSLLAYMCRKRNLPVVSTHEGIIPGTLAFDLYGWEMGASLPAVCADEFQKLLISEADVEKARDVWRYLYESKLNRKSQPQTDAVKAIKNRLKTNRPVVFFAGQNDTSSNMIPYTDTSKKYHSPIFQSSTEAASCIARICANNDWNFVYKPHPMYIQKEQVKALPPNTIFLEMGDINELIDFADVTVTILSATSYNALTRYKPVVMLGYTQIRGKGCTYEAFEKDKIEDAIKAALENGFTQEQQDAFLLHMAQCLKYYLYDDLQDRPIRYGRPVPKSIDEFYELERLLKGNVAAK